MAKPSSVIPLAIAIVCLAIGMLHLAGYINLPQVGKQIKAMVETLVGDESKNEDTIILEDGVVGDPYVDNFKCTDFEGKDCPGSVSFYKDTTVPGDLPPGITLSSDGVVSGKPTKAGTYTFGVCVQGEDVWDCKTVSITVKPKKEPTTTTTVSGVCYPCPTTSCETGECCCVTKNGIRKSGMVVLDCCARCPNDTHEVGKDVITNPNQHYKICKCNKC